MIIILSPDCAVVAVGHLQKPDGQRGPDPVCGGPSLSFSMMVVINMIKIFILFQYD